jgi:hypothetical protein
LEGVHVSKSFEGTAHLGTAVALDTDASSS